MLDTRTQPVMGRFLLIRWSGKGIQVVRASVAGKSPVASADVTYSNGVRLVVLEAVLCQGTEYEPIMVMVFRLWN